jgi:hypothetical protein
LDCLEWPAIISMNTFTLINGTLQAGSIAPA